MTMSLGPGICVNIKSANTVIWAKELSCLSALYWPGQVQKTQNAMSNCLFALGPYISPITNVLLTDLGLSFPLSFIDKCISTSVDSATY